MKLPATPAGHLQHGTIWHNLTACSDMPCSAQPWPALPCVFLVYSTGTLDNSQHRNSVRLASTFQLSSKCNCDYTYVRRIVPAAYPEGWLSLASG